MSLLNSMSTSLLMRWAGLLVGFALGLGGVVGLAVVGLAPVTAVPGEPAVRWIPPDDTIVKVEGNRFDGFGIFYYDGSSIFPPTNSEARAECEEYDTNVAVVRCKTEMRTWYRDLGQLKRALRYAHSSPQ
jgi:hypothetical protein